MPSKVPKPNNGYMPKPTDTSLVQLPTGLDRLLERLAQNTHEVWAAERVAQGWTYGPKRDDEKKTHPNLIPYDELPEEEKVYDRNTAGQTLKLILKLGYRIVDPPSTARPPD